MLQAAEIIVPNPAEYAERVVHPTVKVVRSLRDDPLGQMHHRHQISEAQYAAGRRWQAAFEAAGPVLKSTGNLAEPVDGSPPQREGISQRQVVAYNLFRWWDGALGAEGKRLVSLILADKCSVAEACNRMYHIVTKANLTYTGHRFRECLDTLAKSMGLAS